MVMRVGVGLASGMELEKIVEKLISAERIPLDKMEQDRTKLEWKRDAFRKINTKLSELDNLIRNEMKYSTTYNSKIVSSSLEDAVTATATTATSNGTYQVRVDQLASSAINVSKNPIEIDPTQPLTAGEVIAFSTVNKEGKEEKYTYTIQAGDTLNTVMEKISKDDNNVRMFYDEASKKVIMETTRTGNFNENGSEIIFADTSFLATTLKMDMANEKGGNNAKFEYNNSGIIMESKTNSYTINGIDLQFKNTTNGKNASLTIDNDVEAAYEKIKNFVDKYNEVVEAFNSPQFERIYRDYQPLTDKQKEEMSDKQIELWEERAKSGLLRGEPVITNGLYSLRQSWYQKVETGGEYTSLTQLGISTSPNYLDGGKLIIEDPDKLKDALRDNPEEVRKLFYNREEGESRGLINRLEDSVNRTMQQIGDKAGKTTTLSLDSYTLGKQMKELDERIEAYENRIERVEKRYWAQFTAMEKAISQMNQQSMMLLSQFGGGM
ncbi:flagellar hook-associated protein 2 [Cerasibacillus sp. JNUCC 74]